MYVGALSSEMTKKPLFNWSPSQRVQVIQLMTATSQTLEAPADNTPSLKIILRAPP
jgi:hypothetical protein